MNLYLLGDKKVSPAKNLTLFEIEYLPFSIDIYSYEALIFTSKNAILALDDTLASAWKNVPAFAIAPQTANTLTTLGGTLSYVGTSGNGNGFAHELITPLKDKKVLYLRGQEVVSKLSEILNQNGVFCDEAIVYKTVCKKPIAPISLPKDATIIFSSPSSIKCFFKHFTWQESYKAIAIGQTTAGYFPTHITPIIADTPSLEACVQKAIEINA